MTARNPKSTCGHSGNGTIQDTWAALECAVEAAAQGVVRILGTPGTWGVNDAGDPRLLKAAAVNSGTTLAGWYASLSTTLLSMSGASKQEKLQRLIKTQDAARTNQGFQPSAQTTHCNQATVFVVREVGGPLEPLLDKSGNALLASAQGRQLATSPLYTSVAQEAAQQLANDGSLVLVSWISDIAGEPGHIATIRPQGVKGDMPRSNSHGPLVNNIGVDTRIEGINWVFSKAMLKTIKFYTPK